MSREKRTREIKVRIREAAAQLFAEQGVRGTSVQQIADAVDMSKQALLYHYSSKDTLRKAVEKDFIGHWRVMLPSLVALVTGSSAHDDPELALDVMLQGISHRHHMAARFLMRELIEEDGRRQYDAVSPFMQQATATLRAGQADGSIAADLDADIWPVQAGTLILATMALLPEEPERRRARFRDLVRTLRVTLRP
jgi:TetR/AcrR family transcriptional regulator